MPDGLTWETATTTDVGLDFGMLNNRLQFNGDYYIRKTTDMFFKPFRTRPEVLMLNNSRKL